MSEQLRESLSALKDGESDELELRRLLAHDDVDTINHRWQNLHHMGDLIKGQHSEYHQWDISKRVAEVIAGEPSHSSLKYNDSAKQSAWLKPFAGFAVAASVTLAVVMGSQLFDPAQTGLNPTSSPAVASRVYPAAISNVSAGNVTVGAQLDSRSPLPDSSLSRRVLMGDLAAEQRLEKYLLQHTEQSALNNGQGMMNFARVSSFEQ